MCLRKFQGYGTGMVVQDKKRFLCKIKIKSISCWMFDSFCNSKHLFQLVRNDFSELHFKLIEEYKLPVGVKC